MTTSNKNTRKKLIRPIFLSFLLFLLSLGLVIGKRDPYVTRDLMVTALSILVLSITTLIFYEKVGTTEPLVNFDEKKRIFIYTIPLFFMILAVISFISMNFKSFVVFLSIATFIAIVIYYVGYRIWKNNYQ